MWNNAAAKGGILLQLFLLTESQIGDFLNNTLVVGSNSTIKTRASVFVLTGKPG